jgi:hypothetical protein
MAAERTCEGMRRGSKSVPKQYRTLHSYLRGAQTIEDAYEFLTTSLARPLLRTRGFTSQLCSTSDSNNQKETSNAGQIPRWT